MRIPICADEFAGPFPLRLCALLFNSAFPDSFLEAVSREHAHAHAEVISILLTKATRFAVRVTADPIGGRGYHGFADIGRRFGDIENVVRQGERLTDQLWWAVEHVEVDDVRDVEVGGVVEVLVVVDLHHF